MKNLFYSYLISISLFSMKIYSQGTSYPVPPKTNELLFYIQRNHNTNTIVYDAQYDKNGKLNENNPIVVYWIRYEEDGQKIPLRNVEKRFAYGVKWHKTDSPDKYMIALVADKNHEFLLEQTKPFHSVITTTINHKKSILDHIYI